jgi:acyl-CoA synthetase (AMP-forming)/AMP-acid ligase II
MGFLAHELTIPGVAERAAARWAADDALVGDGAAVRYGTLWHLARVAAAALVDRGVRPGDRVALLADNSPAWAIAHLAILCTGAAVVPLSTRWRDAEIDDVLGRAACRAVLDRDDVDALPQTRASAAARTEVEQRLHALTPDDVSHVQFTAGTTGRPKGALLTHRGMVATTREWVGVVGLRPGDRYPIVNPCSHIGGHKTGLLACMIAGATAYPIARFDPEELRAMIDAEALSFLQGPPAMFQALLDRIDSCGAPAPGANGPPAPDSVRVAVTGSASIPPALVVRMKQTLGLEAVHAGYGLTEATGVCTMTRADDPIELVTQTSGRAIPGVEVRIDSPQPGTEGEILVRGVGVMRGYLDDPGATAEVMRPGAWLATGDIGVLDADGNLAIHDRIKDMVIVGGFNVSPAELERVLAEHPAVAQAAVVGRPDADKGEAPVAYVVAADPGAPPDADELLAHLRARLASYKQPRHLWFVDGLPLTPVPKVDKVALATDARARLGLSDR